MNSELLSRGQKYAHEIDVFLAKRESSVLSKLIAIGGAHEEESFEVQVKVSIDNVEEIINNILTSGLTIHRTRHYREYDTYLFFKDHDQGRLRYREDHFISDQGEVTNVRSRLTLIGVKSERHFPEKVLLSRSRYIAPATQSMRFYREYFNPITLLEIQKDRKRYLIDYQGTEFFINIDDFQEPDLGKFLEIKSRTWSLKDAEKKSQLSIDLLLHLGIKAIHPITEDYVEIIRKTEY